MTGVSSGAYFAIILFLIVLALVWLLLPFAIFGTKAKLDQVIEQLRELNAQVAEIQLQQQSDPADERADTKALGGPPGQ